MPKEKVIHTRISQELYEKISNKSKKYRVTVSQLLRHLVEDYLEVSGDLWDIFDAKVKDLLDKPREEILGFEGIKLNKNTICSLCERSLTKGEGANLAFFEKSHHKVVICNDCRKDNEAS